MKDAKEKRAIARKVINGIWLSLLIYFISVFLLFIMAIFLNQLVQIALISFLVGFFLLIIGFGTTCIIDDRYDVY